MNLLFQQIYKIVEYRHTASLFSTGNQNAVN